MNKKTILSFVTIFVLSIGIVSAQPIVEIISPKNNSTITSESTWFKVSTNKYAVCQYELCFGGWRRGGCNENGCGGDFGYGGCSRPRKMSQTGKLYHLQLIENLRDTINNQTQGESYFANVLCEDDKGYTEESVRFYVKIRDKLSFLKN